MRFINIFSALVWLIAMLGLVITWWFEEPFSTPQRLCIIYGVLYATVVMAYQALESLDELLIIGDQRMDRRPRS